MQYIIGPIVAIIKWTFDHILVPIGELPALLNINNIIAIVLFLGLLYWLFLQSKFNKRAEERGELK